MHVPRLIPVETFGLLAVLAGAAAAAQQASWVPQFQEVTEELGIEFNAYYGGPDKAYPTEFAGSGGLRPHSSLGCRPPAPEATLLQPAALRSAGSNNHLSAPI